MSARVGEASPVDDVYLDLPEIEGEEEEEGQIEGLVRHVLVHQASLPTPPRSLRERCCEPLIRFCQSSYASAFAGTHCLAASVFFFILAKQHADEDSL